MHEMRIYGAATERYYLVSNDFFVLRTKLIEGTATTMSIMCAGSRKEIKEFLCQPLRVKKTMNS